MYGNGTGKIDTWAKEKVRRRSWAKASQYCRRDGSDQEELVDGERAVATGYGWKGGIQQEAKFYGVRGMC